MLGNSVLDLLLVAAAFWVTGRAAARLAGAFWPSGAGPTDTIALGMGVWMVYVFLLATAGLLSVAALVVPLVAAGLAAAAALGLLLKRGAISLPRRLRELAPVEWLGALGLLAVLAVLFVRAAYPSLAWDAAVYHLAVPKRMLAAGGFARIPLCFESLWPLNMQLLYTVALAWRGPQLAATLHWACGALVAFELGVLLPRRTAISASAGVAAAAVFLASPIVRDEMGLAYVDLAFTLFFWLAFAAVRRALAGEQARANLLWAGVLLGLLAGIKLTGILACASLGVLWLAGSLRSGAAATGRASAPAALRGLALLAVPAALLVLPWHVRLWHETGNPVYPFAYERFGGIEWSPRLAHELRAFRDSTGFGRTAKDFLLLPARLILAPNLRRAPAAQTSWLTPGRGFIGFDGEPGRAFLVALPLALWAARRSELARRALAAAAVYAVGWSTLSQQTRYLIPILPLFAAASACGVDLLLARVPRRAARLAASVVVGAAALLAAFAARADAAVAARNLVTMQEVGPALAERLVPPVFRFLNASTPAGARILFVNTNKGYYCDRDYLADGIFEASQVADWLRTGGDADGVGRLLRGAGVTHILYERVDWGIDYPRGFTELLADPRRAAPVFRTDDGRFSVLEVR